MVIDERVTALEEEVADLKRQLEDRPDNQSHEDAFIRASKELQVRYQFPA